MKIHRTDLLRWAVVAGSILALAFLVHFPSMRNFVDLVVGTAWPIAVVVVVFIFREEVIKLVGRVKRIGKDGAEFEQPQQPQRPLNDEFPLPGPSGQSRSVTAGQNPPGGSIEDMIAPVFRPLFRQRSELLRNRLPAAKTTFPALSDADIVIAWAGELGAALHLERASRFIFQSQIDALEALKWRTSTKEAFRPFYIGAVAKAPDVYSGHSFDQWYNFLFAVELIAGTDDAVTVTAAGEAIAMYMAQQNYKAGIA
jgi:hypothetical protein